MEQPALFAIDLHGTPAFHSGSTVEGTVVLELAHAKETSGMVVVLRGESYVYWTGWENTIRGPGVYQKRSTYRCSSTYELINNLAIRIFGDGHRLERIAAGRHEFPFRFQLPSDKVLPRTYEYHKPTDGSPTGYIKYTIEASFMLSQNTSYTTQVDVPVNEVVDTNLPHLSSPLSASKTKSGCLLCCNFGPVSLSVRTDRGGYCHGDSIRISMEVRNNSSRRIRAVQAILRQKAIFRGRYIQNYRHRQLQNIVVYTHKTKAMQMIEDNDIAANNDQEIYNWNDRPLVIPTAEADPTLVTTIANCENLEISYDLVVSLIIQRARNLSVKLPITIGNIPPSY